MSNKKRESADDSQLLASKESSLFRQLVRFYESKQYRKAIKSADQILKKKPNHGETLSMKGLSVSHMGRKEESYALAREGLKRDLKSHVCWHVYGLLYRSDRNYREAIKCYRNALRLDPGNLQIMRDLALLQVQTRDLFGHLETRQQLLQLKAGNRNNWLGLAIANHLCGRHQNAVQLIDGYLSIHEGGSSVEECYEMSELLLYKAWILEEGGLFEDALSQLEKHKGVIVDKVGAKEQKARILMALEKYNEAQDLYMQLLSSLPENAEYHEHLCNCILEAARATGGHPEQELEKTYSGLQQKYPKSAACRRTPITWLRSGAAFEKAFGEYVTPLLHNGVPSIFEDLSPLLQDPEKSNLISSYFERSLKQGDTEIVRGLSALFLAQLEADKGRELVSLGYIDDALGLLPNFPEVRLVKASILKRFGGIKEAAQVAREAADMDPSDRCANSAAVQLSFEANEAENAAKLAETFTKDKDAHGRILNGLDDMQCSWYALGGAHCYLREGRIQEALNRFSVVREFFEDFEEDQFDFHLYCLRKTTLRTYIEALRFIDQMRSRQEFQDATLGCIQALLRLHDDPALLEKVKEGAASGVGLDKEIEKLKLAGSATVNTSKTQAEGEKPKPTFTVTKPLVQASTLVQQLEKHAPNSSTTHIAAFSIHARRGKWLLALKALKHLTLLSPNSPEACQVATRFWHAYDCTPPTDRESISDLVRSVIEAERCSDSATMLNKQQQSCLQGGIYAVAAALEGRSFQCHEAKASSFLELCEAFKARTSQRVELPPLEHKECVRVHMQILSPSPLSNGKMGQLEKAALVRPLANTKYALEWAELCAAHFPHSDYFKQHSQP